jgi:Acetoacetate decarboxylase (ADC)
VPFPSPPWQLRGDMWLSVFPVRSTGTTDRPAGLYAAAFVDYGAGSVLAYRELLVARLVRDRARLRVTVTDIWVDSETSRAGGRSLWAIPKELADLRVRQRRVGAAARAICTADLAGRPVAAARGTGLALPAVPRAPFRLSTCQPREDGTTAVAGVSGSARITPCLVRWTFAADGPLAWLHGRQPVLSARLTDFRITFGG